MVTIDSGVMILLVLIGCYCLYLASALGKLWKQKPGSTGKQKYNGVRPYETAPGASGVIKKTKRTTA